VSGLQPGEFPGLNFSTWLGKVDAVEAVELEPTLQRFTCRNNKLAKLALDSDNFREAVDQLISKYGSDRIGVFVGTTTSGKAETEIAYMHRDENDGSLPASLDILHTHNPASAQNYIQHSLGLDGAGLTISTACSSSAKVFATAHRFMQTGFCDAAIVGGVDSLCLSTLYGFNSLQLMSPDPCRPWDIDRNGISIGEAAGFMLLEKYSESSTGVKFKGYGESSDAYHMSTPHPEGIGSKSAMTSALLRSGLGVSEIDYVNLHGTATPSNDYAEARAIHSLFSNKVSCSSTKGITGHTLGAAGITEAIICSLVLEQGFVPENVYLSNPDPELPIEVLKSPIDLAVNNVMSNSFGFGGSNCSLVFGW
jgi:3-oxoacyl-[acyl-carrier-protein] synthase-1